MTDEEKIIRVNTLKDFGRDGDETLEVPAWIAEQYGFFSEESRTDSPRGVPPCGFVWRVGRER